MKCRYSIKDIDAYLTNRMSEDEEAEFQFHLADCDVCAAEIQHRRALAQGFDNDDIQPVMTVQANSHRRLWLSVASVAAIAIVGVFLFNNRTSVPENQAYQQQTLSPAQVHHADSVQTDSISMVKPCQE